MAVNSKSGRVVAMKADAHKSNTRVKVEPTSGLVVSGG
jgi:hypothetical protein